MVSDQVITSPAKIVPENHDRCSASRTSVMQHDAVPVANRRKCESPTAPKVRNWVKKQALWTKLKPIPTSRPVVDAQRQNPLRISKRVVLLEKRSFVGRQHSATQFVDRRAGLCRQLIKKCIARRTVNIPVPQRRFASQPKSRERLQFDSVGVRCSHYPIAQQFILQSVRMNRPEIARQSRRPVKLGLSRFSGLKVRRIRMHR